MDGELTYQAWATNYENELPKLKRCGDCAHGEAHGFSREHIRRGYPMTIYFWCPLKKHHDVCRDACELYEEGENRRVYDGRDW